MSKSRLEKFLYALYSLDSSDLPTPLSRIEELYNCWVTGEEAPTFKPLSRVEKYLMAILGVYDVDSLPNPLSRVEVLLYKLATGDDNLDDVKSFLSEHEELLAEIIRNGGVGGNIDVEYVMYTLSTRYNTLYNTAEKPVKSAILKGNTLINLFEETSRDTEVDTNYLFFKIVGNQFNTLKPNAQYTLMFDKYIDGISAVIYKTHNKQLAIEGYQYGQKFTFTTKDDNGDAFHIFIKGDTLEIAQQMLDLKPKIMIIEGDYTNADIPYFEGMQSVKMPVLTTIGKNLLNNQNNSKDKTIDADGIVKTFVGRTLSDYVKVSKSKQYAFSGNGHSGDYVAFFDNSKTFIERIATSTFTPKQDGYIRVFQFTSVEALYQIEEGSVATEYEPFKSNILMVNEEVELRGIGNVQDELDLVTGELTQRIYEVVLDGSDDEEWVQEYYNNNDKPTNAVMRVKGYPAKSGNMGNKMLCDKLNTGKSIYSGDTNLGICFTKNKDGLYEDMRIRTQNLLNGQTLDDFKAELKKNPITVQYVLLDESVKTVDLSVLDQDGNNTKLSTFDDITHVILSSEGLIPEAELEVATKNEEVLSTMSLEMNDISTTQNALQKTSDIQSENVDATMIATTEIYEGLL